MSQNEELMVDAVNEASKEVKILEETGEFIHRVGKKFIENKLYTFPLLCLEARKVNYLQRQALFREGNPEGWSAKKDFKMDYIIPTDLYMFMVNLVYRDFWKECNEKVWRSFMKAIIRGDDPMELLKKVRLHYIGTLHPTVKQG